MKTIVSALIALAVLVGISAPAGALDTTVLDTKTSSELDRQVH